MVNSQYETMWIITLIIMIFTSAPVQGFGAISSIFSNKPATSTAKENFLQELDYSGEMNTATPERTNLIKELTLENPTMSPGSTKSFSAYAAGTWRIVYAPHIYTMGKLIGGRFQPVDYILRPDGTMTSHAQYDFPIIGSGWLSVSGTYGSEDENNVCRVDFDKAWVRRLPLNEGSDQDDGMPYKDFDSVPDGLSKVVIQTLGQLGFVKAVSVFPVSYLDNDTIVFDFELLGTRICARKVGPAT